MRQLGASQHETADPFRKRAHDAAHAGLDDETALDAGLPLDFEGRRDGIVFLGHSKLLAAARAESARTTMGRGLKLVDPVDHTPRQHVTRLNRRRDVRLEARLECLWRFPGDFLE